MRVFVIFVLALMAMVNCAAFATPEARPPRLPYKEIEVFVANLRAALTTRSPERAAKFFAFPFDLRRDNRPDKSIDKTEFLASFDAIFTPDVVKAVMKLDHNSVVPVPDGRYSLDGQAIMIVETCERPPCRANEYQVKSINLWHRQQSKNLSPKSTPGQKSAQGKAASVSCSRMSPAISEVASRNAEVLQYRIATFQDLPPLVR